MDDKNKISEIIAASIKSKKHILEDEAFHNVPQGQIWEWDSYRSYHAGTCMGVHHQYLFHFLGRPNK